MIAWRGILNIPPEEFWAMSQGEFDDLIAAHLIITGADEDSTKTPTEKKEDMWNEQIPFK